MAMPQACHPCENVRGSHPKSRCPRAMIPYTAHNSRHGFPPLRSVHTETATVPLTGSRTQGARFPYCMTRPRPSPPPSPVVRRSTPASSEHLNVFLSATVRPRPKCAATSENPTRVCYTPRTSPTTSNPATSAGLPILSQNHALFQLPVPTVDTVSHCHGGMPKENQNPYMSEAP